MDNYLDQFLALDRERAEAMRGQERAQDAWNQAFDKFLETSNRPIGLRDLMFALAVHQHVMAQTLYAIRELYDQTPKEQQVHANGPSFGHIDHDELRPDLFNLYFAHVPFPDDFLDNYQSPLDEAKHQAPLAKHRVDELMLQRTKELLNEGKPSSEIAAGLHVGPRLADRLIAKARGKA